MDETFLHVLISVCGFLLVTLWGMNLWEIRQLRKDNRDLATAIANLTSTIAQLQVELSHCVTKEACANHRMDNCKQ